MNINNELPNKGRAKTGSLNPTRDKKIVYLLDMHVPPLTLEEVGQKYGMTRERIRQIYKRETGKHYRRRIQAYHEKIIVKRERIRRKSMNEVVYYCKACGIPVKRKDREISYCKRCSQIIKNHRDPNVLITCQTCGKEFHPFRNWKYEGGSEPRFCSTACYLASDRIGRPPKKRGLFSNLMRNLGL